MSTSRPEAQRALLRAGATPSDEETERFYALRVSDYARVLALIFTILYAVGVIATLVLAPEAFLAFHLHPAKLANLAFVVLGAAIWRLTASPRCPRWIVVASDALLPVGVALMAVLASPSVPRGLGLFFVPLLLMALLVMLRAALVPSDPRRTALVGVATAIPIIAAVRVVAEGDSSLEFPFTLDTITFGATVWCAALVAAAMLVSRTIYGLQREVLDAKKLGPYVLGELIGEGGMGAVYRAEHALLRRPTAVKLLLPERVGPQMLARFEREVQLTARLTHPNTIAIYDYGRTAAGVFYYAMEYVDGVSLEALVGRDGPQPAPRVSRILGQIAGALAEAHDLGMIHRDVKPANVLLCVRAGVADTVKLLDFGLVKDLGPSQSPELTHADAIMGTPHYLAPESITNPAGIDHRVDLYALGAVGYFLLAGTTPFSGSSALEICGHHLHTPPKPPSARLGAPVPAELEALVLRCLAKNREERPADARAIEAALGRAVPVVA